MSRVYIDGIEYQARDGVNMLEVALENGLDLPYFCWHPAMGSVGSCRLCAVRVFKDESDTRGKIQMACMTPALEGTRISIRDPEAAEFRRYVIEWLMINHPHDCPVCDEGGECHLQDMTAMCGHVYRRYRGRKRTYRNQYLGPFVNHEMNRCIQCYRCVRFYRDLAGGRDLNVFGSRNRVYFGRYEDGVLESEFSGNLVEVCPTGVFTDGTLKRHYTRKWDLETAPSVCVHCGLGCNTIPGARYAELRRIRARFSREVNGYFLCDRGRYGYEFVNGEERVASCVVRDSGGERTVPWNDAIRSARAAIAGAKGVVGIGSPRASLESNHALRELVGRDCFATGLSHWEHEAASAVLGALRESPELLVSLGEVEKADAVLLLGADPTNEAPMLDFALRQAMRKAPLDIARKLRIHDWDANAVANALQDARGALYTASPWPIKIEEIAVGAHHGPPPAIADFGRDVLACLRALPDQPEEDDKCPECSGITSVSTAAARALKYARYPLVVTSVSAGADVVRVAAGVARGLCAEGRSCKLFVAAPEANTLGVAMMGGLSVDEALSRLESGGADTLVVLENDLLRRVGSAAFERAIAGAAEVIAIDCIQSATSRAASMLLPSAAWVESTGTLVNNECRAQRFHQVFVPKRDVRPAWRVLADAAGHCQWSIGLDALRELAGVQPEFEPALLAAPGPDWRAPAGRRVARMSHRFSGRTAKDADTSLREPRPPDDPETPLAFSMEGEQNPSPGPLAPRFWWPGWNSDNAINRFQIEIGGSLRGGGSGARLIGPNGSGFCRNDGSTSPNNNEAEAEQPGQSRIWLVPRQYIFGSEELSRFSPGVAELAPPAVVCVHPAVAGRFGLEEDALAAFTIKGHRFVLPVRIDESLPEDVASVPANLNETTGIVAPVRCSLERAE